MNVKKKNIHMDRIKCAASTQITIDADVNVPDSKPDIQNVLLEKGWIKIEEKKALENQVMINGVLYYSMLYQCEGADTNVCCIEGKISFEEVVHVEGAEPGDRIKLKKQLEAMSIELINSRKISIRAIAVLSPEIEELYEEEVPYEIEGVPMLQKKKKQLATTELAMEKRDMLRIREEILLPSSLPNIAELIWDSSRICTIEFKPMDGGIYVQGELQVFFLYETEKEDEIPVHYETRLPFNTQIDCSGCAENMTAMIQYETADSQLEIKPDEDGEDRLIELDMNLDLDIKLYQEEKTDILEDIYGVTQEAEGIYKEGHYRRLLSDTKDKCIATGKLKLKSPPSKMTELCAVTGELIIDETMLSEGVIETAGVVDLQILYTDLKEPNQFYAQRGSIPFNCRTDVKKALKGTESNVEATISQIAYSMLGNEEIEINIQINLHSTVFQNIEESFLKDVEIRELNSEKMKQLPSMIGYIAKEGDTIWQLGKQYYVPVGDIMEANNLSSEILSRGDKLIIIKSISERA